MITSAIERNTESQESVMQKFAYSVEELSEQTSLSKAYLRQKIKEGKLKGTYFGRRVLILREDCEEFLKNGLK